MFELWNFRMLLVAALFGIAGCNNEVELLPEETVSGHGVVTGDEPGFVKIAGAASIDAIPMFASNNVDASAERNFPDAGHNDELLPVSRNPSIAFDETRQQLDCLIEPNEISEVATSIAGVLEEVMVGRGDRVKAGQIIARLRSNVEKANVDLARAELKFRERNFKRWLEMHEQSYASNYEKDEAENRMEIARHDLERAEQMLNERIIRSPFDGVVVEQYLSPGELSEDRKIFRLAKIDILNVEVIAPVHMLGRIHKGMRAKVYPEGPVEGPFLASVTVVDPIVDAASGTLGMRLELPNPDYKIPAGVKCRIDFEAQRNK